MFIGGLICLTTSVSVPYLKPPPCDTTERFCSKATPLQIGVFFISLYLIALGTGGHKPCIEAFGADQFDGDGEEDKHRSSFFNWWYFGQCFGALIALSIVLYIEENIGWGVGFAIPTVAMALALFVFLCGSVFYQHKLPSDNLLVCVRRTVSECFVRPRMDVLHLDHLKFPDGAVGEDKQPGEKSTSSSVEMQIEEFKLIQRLIPIWATCLMYGIVFAQSATFFTKQGSTMDRKIGGHFQIPPASLQCLIAISILVLVPVYDWMLVPVARKFTNHKRGITLLQRIGFGMFIAMVAMVVAALTEIKRLKEVKDNDLEDMPDAIVPMTIFWLLPQYVLYGISEVFTMVGMQEYFYDQMPQSMRSLGIAVFLSVLGIGSFLSSIIISIVDDLSSRSSEGSWFSDNLNKAHLDYYYWLLAALSAINLCIYIFCAKRYNNVKVESNVLVEEDMQT
ncbi:protein NRT1/ PTR FAMILY 5.10 isoform X2 [Cryptomeria japonica]|uniref:protein NRT1/ PTR FAMILY 5.10 isoform X2 n=1 Tax=Cryptomeria japonica TaxID=3369 RepID=UPI0027DA0ABF|nr:protein NRT1/ PTR FAMILY 5.10 isoform X2 [Cryptomeria japonica]